MIARGEKDARSLALTGRGAVQLALGAALLAAGLVGGWLAPAAGGIALFAACVTGLAEVLLARRSGPRGAWRRLVGTCSRVESWVRVNHRGEVVESVPGPGGRRGLYRQQSVRLTWTDAFGFWRAARVEPAARELRVPPAVSPELLRAVMDGPAARIVDRSPEQDPTGVRPYERGDGIRQISWRQTAHHGELMSFERSGRGAPPVLVVADTLGAGAGDALAATTTALLQGLRRNPDVLLTDGERLMRMPVQQERFCAAVTGEPADGDLAEARAREVARIAGSGSDRRRVLLVTDDPDGTLARALRRGPLGGSVTVVRSAGGAAPGDAREGPAEKGDAVAPGTPGGRVGRRPSVIAELLALLACVALALLADASLASMIHEGAWSGPVPLLLCAGAATGSLLGSTLRWRRVGGAGRATLAGALAVAIVAAGAALALSLLDARHGPLEVIATADGSRAVTALEDPVAGLRLIFATGADQLGGAASSEADMTWDLLALLMGSGLAALLAVLASSRALRGAVALVPLALAAADQSIMGPSARLDWMGAVIALGLLLVWLSVTARPRPVRGLLVALLAAALGWGGAAIAPTRDFSPWTAGGTRVETLVDLSRDLRNRSDEPVLTYETTALGPVYLRLGVLDSFDGDTWSFEGTEGDSAEGGSPLYWAGQSGGIEGDGYAANIMPLVTTALVPDEETGQDVPVPPGTAVELPNDDGSLVASGCYLSPITGESYLDTLLGLAPSLGSYDFGGDGPGEQTAATPESLPDGVTSVVDRARAEGAGASAGNIVSEVETVRWLVSFFTDGSFSYSLNAPGGDGRDNLEAMDDFLVEREGYCTHYATAFALLARELGVPARVALGYVPDSTRDASGDYVVTMSQLHAWAEVWFDGIGWIGVDVTPAAGEPAATPEPQAEPEEEPAETPNAPVETPAQPETTPQESEPAEKNGETDATPADWRGPVLLALVVVVAGGIAAVLAQRRRVTSWQGAWARVCRAARRSGVRWDASATENEVCALVCERLRDESLAAEVRTICRRACLERYGEKPVPFTQAPLRGIARALRASRGAD